MPNKRVSTDIASVLTVQKSTQGEVKKYHVFTLDCHVNIGFTVTKNKLFAKPGGLHWKRKHF